MPARRSAPPPAPRAAAPPPAPRAAGGFAPAVAAIVLAWAVAFAPQLLAGRAFTAGDWAANQTFAEFSAARWRAVHQRTLWNPYVFLGLPAAASLADARPQYLPGPLLDALDIFDRLPVWPPLVLPLLAHLAGMLAAAALARALWRAGPWPAAWAGLAWGLLPNQIVPVAYAHQAQLVTVALMPVSLLLVHALFAAAQPRRAWAAALALAPVTALALLAGHPQFAYYSLALAGAFALERARAFRRGARLPLALGAAALGVALAAAVWLPMLAYGADSVRGGAGVQAGEVARYSLALRDLAILVWPRAMGFADPTYWGGMAGTDYPQYAGLAVVALAALGATRLRGDGAAQLLAGAALVAVALAFGAHLGPLYGALRVLPFFSQLRVAVATLIVAQLALALLSARGLERALAAPRARVWALAAAGAALLAGGVSLAAGPLGRAWLHAALAARPGLDAAAMAAAAAHAPADLALRLALAAAVAAAIAAAAAWRGAARLAGPALALLVAVDLGSVSLPLLRAASGSRAALEPPPPALARAVAARPGTRGYADDLVELGRSNDWVRWRAPFVGGAHGTPPVRWQALIGSGYVRAPAIQRALAVSVAAAPARGTLPAADYAPLPDPADAWRLWRLRAPLPRAYAVGAVRWAGGDAATLAAMAAGDSFPQRVAFASDPAAAGDYPGSAACAIRWTGDAPDAIALETAAPEPAYLVIADAWFAGWRARVDGVPQPIQRVNFLLRGLPLPPGRHRVRMTYRPPGWGAGVAITQGAAVAWLLLALGAWLGPRALRPRPSRPPAAATAA